MPRITRATKILEDDAIVAAQVPLPGTPVKQRAPLAEIPNPVEGISVEDAQAADELKSLKAAYKTAIGIKKSKGKGKKGKKQQAGDNAAEAQVVTSDNKPAVVSAAAEAAGPLLNSDGESINMANDMPQAPTSPAVYEVRQKLANDEEAKESLGDTGVANGQPSEVNAKVNEDIKTPGRRTLAEIEQAYEPQGTISPKPETEDSFVEHIISRSPSKPVSRIEDSVEALDKLEDVLAVLDEVAMAQKLVSKADKNHSSSESSNSGKAKSTKDTETRRKVAAKDMKKPSSVRVKTKETVPARGLPKSPAIVKTNSVTADESSNDTESTKGKEPVARKPVKRPTSLLPPKLAPKSSKPPTRPNFELPGEAVSKKLKEQREARDLKRLSTSNVSNPTITAPPPRVKSTKPPTKPTFELPGEALSRRKREQNEARLRVQEEEERKRREFKAKPIRKSVAPDVAPRETVASRARKSQAYAPEQGSLSVGKRGSVVGAHRPSLAASNLANTSAPRTPGPASAARKISPAAGPSMSGLQTQRVVSASEAQLQRQRAKEIYKRESQLLEEQERHRKEREAAAKKSREEAAERGRQASREWAEKQRVKKVAEADKGMAPGFGPGGQIGLKA